MNKNALKQLCMLVTIGNKSKKYQNVHVNDIVNKNNFVSFLHISLTLM